MGNFSIVLFSDSKDRFYEAVSFAAAARARGETVQLFLRGPAVRAFVENRWKEPEDNGIKKGLAGLNEDSAETLASIHDGKKVQIYACSAWIRMIRLESARVAQRVDAVIGLNAFLSQAQCGPILYVG